MKYQEIVDEFVNLGNSQRALFLSRFFKTGPGEYAEGDILLGISVPTTREYVKKYASIDLETTEKLVQNKYHEVRLLGLLILVNQYTKTKSTQTQKDIYELYLRNTKHINNWDLVDLSADRIVGAYLESDPYPTLEKLARSKSLWERRISILATFCYIKKGNPDPTLKIASLLLSDKHDLIHKAVGWMLREVGKRCSEDLEELFIQKYYNEMDRTTLRYAIEKFNEQKRIYYLKEYKQNI